jgi:HSP20 family protein
MGTPINADMASAQFENGVLTLTLPKSEQARPKQIKLGGG